MSYIKDANGVVINNDISHYNSIVALRNSQRNAESMNNEIVDLRSELQRINQLLAQVINRD